MRIPMLSLVLTLAVVTAASAQESWSSSTTSTPSMSWTTGTTSSGGTFSKTTTRAGNMTWTTGTVNGSSYSNSTYHSPSANWSQSWGDLGGQTWSSHRQQIGNSTWRTWTGSRSSGSSWTTHYGSGLSTSSGHSGGDYGGGHSGGHGSRSRGALFRSQSARTAVQRNLDNRSSGLSHWERTSGYSNGRPITQATYWESRKKWRRLFANGAERAKVERRLATLGASP